MERQPRMAAVAEAGSIFYASLQVLLGQLASEHQSLLSQGVARDDPRHLAYAADWATMLAVVNTASESARDAWVALHTARMLPGAPPGGKSGK